MKVKHSALVTRLHNLFFDLSFIHQPPTAYRVLMWVLEKAILLSALILPVYWNTPWSRIDEYLVNLNILKRFSETSAGLSTFCFFAFGLFQVFLALLIYRLVRQQAVPNLLNWIVSLGMSFVQAVYLPLVACVGTFLFVMLIRGSGTTFASYKGIYGNAIDVASPIHITLCTLFGLLLLQVIALEVLSLLLTQEDRMTLKQTRSLRLKLANLVSKLGIIIAYVSDAQDTYAIAWTASLGSVFLAKLAMWFWTPFALRDVPEYAYDNAAVILVALDGLSSQLGMKDYYSYTVLIPVFVVLSCVIRLLVLRFPLLQAELKTEEGVVAYLRTVVELCQDQDKAGIVRVYALLEQHRQGCSKPGCGCSETSLQTVAKNWGEAVKYNYTTYETAANIPEGLKNSCRLKLLNILISDVKPAHMKSTPVSLALAEIYYYFFANHYQALLQVQSVESSTNSMVLHQYTHNMRNVIEEGMNKRTEENESLLSALSFQAKYYEFLSCIDYSCECTVKFWEILLDERPNPSPLTHLGREIYETSQKVFKLVKNINRTNSDHLEFLLKFGLYSKYILHDRPNATYAFQRITWNAENSNFGTRKDQVMILVVSLEQHNFMNILEINSELEHQFGFRREELIGFPASRLMHSALSRQHQDIVQRFFQSMNSTQLGVERPQFIRHQEGHVVPCKAKKKVVPTLEGGLRGMMMLYLDPAMSLYTVQKTDNTKRKAGAFICDNKLRVTEFTKNVLDELRLHKEILLSGVTLQNIFPELKDEAIVEYTSRSKGAVVLFNPANANEDFIPDEEDRRRLEASSRKLQVLTKQRTGDLFATTPGQGTNAGHKEERLVWIRLVKEMCGDDNLFILLFSPIQHSNMNDYRPSLRFNSKIFERADSANSSKDNPQGRRKNDTRLYNSSKGGVLSECDEAQELLSTSQASSMGSLTSGSAKSQQEQYIHEEMQQSANGKLITPTIVKRLIMVLIGFLVIVIILVCAETYVFYQETNNLMERFQMIESFNIRYALIIYMSACAMSYDSYRRANDPVNFVNYCYRAKYRANRAAEYNVLLKKSFAKFGLDYDYENIRVQSGTDYYLVSFNYALLKYINEILTYTKIDDYYASRACVGDYTTPACLENNLALDYCRANGVYTMRPYEGQVSVALTEDLQNIASAGKNELYILMSVCIVIVFLSSVFILVLLIWVIKDKSNVMAIFAEVKNSEINAVLAQIRGLNISEARLEQRLLKLSEGNESRYWHFYESMIASGIGSGSLALQSMEMQAKSGITSTPSTFAPIKKEKGPQKASKKSGEEPKKVPSGDESPKSCSSEEEDQEKGKDKEIPGDKTPEVADLELMAQKKKQHEEERRRRLARREVLSRIDSSLRNKSALKLSIVLIFFLIYGGASLYFNYYVHDFNSLTTDFFYELTKRNTYSTSIGLLMREAVRMRNKQMLHYSGDPKNMYMMDYIDGAWKVEDRIKEYNSVQVDRKIFKNYLDLTEKLDSSQFCAYVDGYKVGQSGNCNVTYGGPQQQGLTAGVAFYLTYHVVFAAKIMAVDFTNETVASALQFDLGVIFPWAKVMIYLQSALEQQMIEYRKDALNFYSVVKSVIIAKAVCFVVLFIGIYIAVFVGLLNTLKSEIWLTRGIARMIPLFVMEHNRRVQRMLYLRKRAAVNQGFVIPSLLLIDCR